MNDIEPKQLTLENLASSIRQLHNQLSDRTKRAVNVALTLRNWLIGYYIAEYELHGEDKAKYGEHLIENLADRLNDLSNCHKRQLHEYLLFYRTWPQIVPTMSALSQTHENSSIPLAKVPTLSALLSNDLENTLIARLSFSIFKELLYVENPTARQFYETECLKGNWSVRELKRQIGSLLYERTAMSANKTEMINIANAQAERDSLRVSIRDPYVFDFLGLKAKELVSERQLEDALLDRLQDFLLELGHGFCFEARQKRLLIGNEYFDVDLVFYHRILKCHVLIELKDAPFSHESIGQLNTYVNYYQQNEMSEGDNPPIGILLCTQKNNELVEYALAGMNPRLFVSKYQLALPSKQDMEDFLHRQRADLD